MFPKLNATHQQDMGFASLERKVKRPQPGVSRTKPAFSAVKIWASFEALSSSRHVRCHHCAGPLLFKIALQISTLNTTKGHDHQHRAIPYDFGNFYKGSPIKLFFANRYEMINRTMKELTTVPDWINFDNV